MIAPRLQSSGDLRLGALQRDLGPVHQAGRTRRAVPAGDAGVGGLACTAWPSSSIPPGSSRTTRPATTTTSRPTSTPGTPTCPATPGASTSTRSTQGHLPRLEVELHRRPHAGRPAAAQQRVRQRLGLRGQHRRRRLELGLPHHDERVPAPSEDLRLALHRAPRRHQRVERLLSLRPLARSSPAWRSSLPGMTLRDLHAPFYVAAGRRALPRRRSRARPCRVPLWASFLTDCAPAARADAAHRRSCGWDTLGREREWCRGERRACRFEPWMSRGARAARGARCPSEPRAGRPARWRSRTPAGRVLHRNFTTFLVGDGPAPRRGDARAPTAGALRVLRFAPGSFASAAVVAASSGTCSTA